MPVAQIGIFLVLNIIFIENIQTFDNIILYFIPFIALTVLGGIWGFNLAVRMISPQYQNLKLAQKYFSFQLVLFFCKIQPIFLNILMKQVITSCEGPFTIVVKRHSKRYGFIRLFLLLSLIFFPYKISCNILNFLEYLKAYIYFFLIFSAVIQILVQMEITVLSIWSSVLYTNPSPLNK